MVAKQKGRKHPTLSVCFLFLYYTSKVEATESLVREMCEWGCVVVVGPARSGKTTVITAAIKLFQRQYVHAAGTTMTQRTPSTAHKSSTRQERGRSITRQHKNTSHRERSSSHHSHLETATEEDAVPVDEIDDSTVEILNSSRQLVDRHVYTLRPQVIERICLQYYSIFNMLNTCTILCSFCILVLIYRNLLFAL